jgi:hypothetical protein
MTDQALRAVGDSWHAFMGSPAHKWLVSEIGERMDKSRDAILAANPLDMILHPFRFMSLWSQHKEAKHLYDEIIGMQEDYAKLVRHDH